MDGVLTCDVSMSPALAVGQPRDEFSQWVALPEEVLAGACEEFLQRRQENAELRRENAELKQLAGYWKAMHARAVQREAKLTEELQAARGEIRQLQDKLFGRKSERAGRRDRSNQLEDPQEPAKPARRRGQQPGRPGPGRRDYAHLPAVEEFVELPEDQHCCPQCGQPRRPMSDTEDSEQLEIEVRAHRRVIRRRRNEATCQCPDQPRTLTAPAPPKLIPKSRLGTSVWVHLLLEKFCLHRPMERTLAALELSGLPLSAGTVTGGLRRLEPLFAGIYQALMDRQVASDFSQADETRWLVFVEREGKQGYRWWLWVFLSDEAVVFRLDPSRSHEVPERHFPKEATLVLMVDRYSAYKAMVQVKQGGIVLVFCWAHVRRDFVEVGKGWPELKEWALAWLRRIRELYHLNRRRLAAEPDSAEHREAEHELRQAVQAMQEQRDRELADDQLREPCRKALQSLQEHWAGLVYFVDDPRVPMDNNRSERQVRGPAMGRKNYYGSGSEWSGRLAVMLFSIFATLKLWKLNPHRWLTWFLEACATAGGRAPADISGFLPWNLTPEQRAWLAGPAPQATGPPHSARPATNCWEMLSEVALSRPPPETTPPSRATGPGAVADCRPVPPVSGPCCEIGV
jgi:transposase